MDLPDEILDQSLIKNENSIEPIQNHHLRNVQSLILNVRTCLSQLSQLSTPKLDLKSIRDSNSLSDLIPLLESSFDHQNRINRLSLCLHNLNFTVNFWNLIGNIALRVILLL